MIEYSGQEGGRFTYIDDILNLQNLSLAFSSIFADCGNFIISGCEITNNSISSGYVYINGKIRNFSGAVNVSSFPVYIYETNSIKTLPYANSVEKCGRNIFSCEHKITVPDANDPITGKLPQYIEVTLTSAPRLKDAFFGKYALMIDSTRNMQTVEKDIVLKGAMSTTKGMSTSGELKIISPVGTCVCSCNADNDFIIKYQMPNKQDLKLILSPSGEFKFLLGSVVCATINDKGINLGNRSVTGGSAKYGNISISGSDIFNTGVSSDTGELNLNRIGHNNESAFYRNLNIYNGKGELCYSVVGSSKSSNIYGPLTCSSSDPNGLTLIDSANDKTNVAYTKNIRWNDKDGVNIGKIGYSDIANNDLSIHNEVGNIVIFPSSYTDFKCDIKENGAYLKDKYTLSTYTSSQLKLKADAANVYSKDVADTTFVSLSGGIGSMISYLSTNGDATPEKTITDLLKVSSTVENDKAYVSRTKNLSDVAKTEDDKKAICNNIGAAYAATTQEKLKDTGWQDLITGKLYIRQIGNIVCIEGGCNIGGNVVLFHIPNNIDPPHSHVEISRGQFKEFDRSRGWVATIYGGERDCNITHSTLTGDFVFSLTYMV